MKIIKKSITTLIIVAMAFTLAMPVTAQAKAKPTLNKTKLTINVKKSYQLKVKGTSKKAKWTTSNKKVVAVNSKGKITAKKRGTAKITAKVSGKRYTCKVTVKQPVTSITLNKKTATLTKKGATVSLKATAKPTNANNRKVTWKSSNTKVAKVSSKGVVTAVANGTATIAATAADGSKKKATCKVTVKNSNNISHKHDYYKSSWFAPTCDLDGEENYCCSICYHKYTKVIPATGHNYVEVSKGIESFTGKSFIKYQCTKCDRQYSQYPGPRIDYKKPHIHCHCGMDFQDSNEYAWHCLYAALAGETNGHSNYNWLCCLV